MENIYLVISAWDQDNVSLGFILSQSLTKEQINIKDLHFYETNLVYSGWASNSFNLFLVGKNEKKLESFVNEISEKFDNILREHYDEPDLDKIDFDDHSLEQEFEELISHLKEKFTNIEKLLDEENRVYKLSLE